MLRTGTSWEALRFNLATLSRSVDPAVEEPQAPEATPDPAAEQPAAPVGRACANCGAPLADDQEWCLECGTAVRAGRPSLPGWRTGAATVVATVVLASGAVAAAYAAITSDDDTPSGTQIAQVLPGDTGASTDAVPQPDPIDIPSEQEVPPLEGAAPPAPPASTDVPPPVAPPPAPTPVAPSYTPPPVTPSYTPPVTGTTPPPSSGTTTDNGGKSGSNTGDRAEPVKRAPLEQVTLTPGTTVVAAYNPPAPGATTPPASTTTTPTDPTQTTTTPADPTQTTTSPTTTTPATPNGKIHPDTDFTGDPSAAFDGDASTAWSVALGTPELVLEPQAGLLIDLGSATKLRQLVVTPTTPGTTIEVYGSDAETAPATVDDKGWKKLATQLDVDGKTKITLGKDAVGTGKVRQLLIWFAAGPDDGTSTSVGISELQLYR
jgi:hypothetical protein